MAGDVHLDWPLKSSHHKSLRLQEGELVMSGAVLE